MTLSYFECARFRTFFIKAYLPIATIRIKCWKYCRIWHVRCHVLDGSSRNCARLIAWFNLVGSMQIPCHLVTFLCDSHAIKPWGGFCFAYNNIHVFRALKFSLNLVSYGMWNTSGCIYTGCSLWVSSAVIVMYGTTQSCKYIMELSKYRWMRHFGDWLCQIPIFDCDDFSTKKVLKYCTFTCGETKWHRFAIFRE